LLSRRSGRGKFRKFLFQFLKGLHHLVIFRIGNDRVVQDIIAVGMIAQGLTQPGNRLPGLLRVPDLPGVDMYNLFRHMLSPWTVEILALCVDKKFLIFYTGYNFLKYLEIIVLL
jgi:hypothetical protein